MKFKTEQEWLDMAIDKAEESDLITTDSGLRESIQEGQKTENQYVVDLATHAYINGEMSAVQERIYESFDLATARGESLDKFGNLVNVPRLPGIPAKLVVTVNLAVAQQADIIIQPGTRVLIDPTQVPDYVVYTTDETTTIKAGVTTATIYCSSNVSALQGRVSADSVTGLEGYPTLAVRNEYAGTNGRNMENDDEYRQRLQLWSVKNIRGTEESFKAYLGQVQGLDDYKLIPRDQGVGTLTVLCDCVDSMLADIEEGIQKNCMLFTDEHVVCAGPILMDLDVEVECVSADQPLQYTLSELTEMVQHEVGTFIGGGVTRTGESIHGLRIADDFIPSQLVMHLHNMFPELVSIECVTQQTSLTQYQKIRVGDVVAVIT